MWLIIIVCLKYASFIENPCARMQKTQQSEKTVCCSNEIFSLQQNEVQKNDLMEKNDEF